MALKLSRTAVFHHYGLKITPAPDVFTPTLVPDIIQKFKTSPAFANFASKAFNSGGAKIFIIGETLPPNFSARVSVADAYNVAREFVGASRERPQLSDALLEISRWEDAMDGPNQKHPHPTEAGWWC